MLRKNMNLFFLFKMHFSSSVPIYEDAIGIFKLKLLASIVSLQRQISTNSTYFEKKILSDFSWYVLVDIQLLKCLESLPIINKFCLDKKFHFKRIRWTMNQK